MFNFSRISLILALFTLAQCSYESQNTQDEIDLSVLSSLERLNPGSAVEGKSLADIKAAKNEYEAFQLVISAGKNLKLENVY